MNKALLKFSPLEHAYNNKFGMMPDYHFEKLLSEKCVLYNKEKGSCEKCFKCPCNYQDAVGDIINANMKEVWDSYKHIRTFVDASKNPFQGGAQ